MTGQRWKPIFHTFPAWLMAGLLALAVTSGCISKPLLYGVRIEPSLISPNADGKEDVARILYRVGRPATLSIYLVDSQGQRHYFRRDGSRSPGEEYEAWFGGTIEGQMLPDGSYRVVLEAVDGQGHTTRAEAPLEIREADVSPPELRDFALSPPKFTPNQDGISDRVNVNFYLTKKATVRVYLVSERGEKFPLGPEREAEPGVVEYDYDGGVDKGMMPPPDGRYTVVAEAVDAVGNRTERRASLTIEAAGLPRAEIVSGEFSPLVVPLGGRLTFTATVRNIGTAPLRTTGPTPGATYRSDENFDTRGFYQEPGAFRLGVDYEGNSFGREYPYRWALGEQGYLMPGEKATIVGHIIIVEPTPYYEPYFWFGLVHERVRKINDRHNPTQITIAH